MSVTDVAIVICTRNRANQLKRMLETLRTLKSNRRWELVVVDSASTDGTRDVVSAFAAGFPQPLTLISADRPGKGLAMTVGFEATSAGVILLTDDDCYPAPDWIEATCQCFEEDSTLGALGGRILLHDPQDYPITIQLKPDKQRLFPPCVVEPGLLQGANLAFRREALIAVGGFDSRLGAGTPFASEDVDAVARVSAAGWAVGYDPRPTVSHHHGRRLPADVSRLMESYDYGRGAFYAKMLADPRVRRIYARKWMRTCRYGPLRVTGREISGALRFAWIALFG